MQEYPKTLYQGTFNPEVGIAGSMRSRIITTPAEEKAARKQGWYGHDELEANKAPDPDAPAPAAKNGNGKDKKPDAEGGKTDDA